MRVYTGGELWVVGLFHTSVRAIMGLFIHTSMRDVGLEVYLSITLSVYFLIRL